VHKVHTSLTSLPHSACYLLFLVLFRITRDVAASNQSLLIANNHVPVAQHCVKTHMQLNNESQISAPAPPHHPLPPIVVVILAAASEYCC